MDRSTHHRRLFALVCVHLLLGLGMAVAAAALDGAHAPAWLAVWFMALVCSEVLLLGAWAGLSAAHWWVKLVGLIAGIVWFGLMGASPLPLHAPGVLRVFAIVGVPTLAIALLFGCCRWWFARLVQCSTWEPPPLAEELQFSLRSLIGLTILVAVLLSLGRLVQAIDGDTSNLLLVVCMLVLVASLAIVLLVWSCLANGQLIARLPAMFAAVVALGFVFPFYLGGPSWRYIVWPAIMALIAVYSGASLLVVRSCGYRLVRVPSRSPSLAAGGMASPEQATIGPEPTNDC